MVETKAARWAANLAAWRAARWAVMKAGRLVVLWADPKAGRLVATRAAPKECCWADRLVAWRAELREHLSVAWTVERMAE